MSFSPQFRRCTEEKDFKDGCLVRGTDEVFKSKNAGSQGCFICCRLAWEAGGITRKAFDGVKLHVVRFLAGHSGHAHYLLTLAYIRGIIKAISNPQRNEESLSRTAPLCCSDQRLAVQAVHGALD